MPGVARLGDTIDHGGHIISASPDVWANNLGVARVGDKIRCDRHGEQTIITGSYNVLVNGQAVAHVGSLCSCGAVVNRGSTDVFVD